MESKMSTQYVEDGQESVTIAINGETLITIHKAGYSSLGMTYEQARMFGENLGNLIISAHGAAKTPEAAPPPSDML